MKKTPSKRGSRARAARWYWSEESRISDPAGCIMPAIYTSPGPPTRRIRTWKRAVVGARGSGVGGRPGRASQAGDEAQNDEPARIGDVCQEERVPVRLDVDAVEEILDGELQRGAGRDAAVAHGCLRLDVGVDPAMGGKAVADHQPGRQGAHVPQPQVGVEVRRQVAVGAEAGAMARDVGDAQLVEGMAGGVEDRVPEEVDGIELEGRRPGVVAVDLGPAQPIVGVQLHAAE